MKNPLVLFVGAAVMAVAALAGVTADRWQDWAVPFQPTAASPEVVVEEPVRATAEPEMPEMKDPAPRVDTAEQVEPRQVPPEPPSGPETAVPLHEPVVEPEIAEAAPGEAAVEVPAEVPVGEPDEPVAEPERLAAVTPQELELAAPSAPAMPEPDATVDPSFDVVRLEDDGSLIVAGRAAPGAEVALLLGGEVIARDAANQFGAWLIMPDEPLSPGSHELMVQASDGLGVTTSSQAIALAVPQRAEDRPLATRSEPARPDAPDTAAEVAELPVLEEEPAPEEVARLEPAETLPGEADEEQVALAPVPVPVPVVEPEAPRAPEAVPQVREAEPEELAAIAPETETEPEVEPVPERLEVPLALETIDYNDDGDIVFSGRASSGRTVRIYVDSQLVGEATTDADGRWVFAGDGQIAAGRHTLRADLMGETGRILGRIILPFVRAGSREVAVLVDGRRAAAERREAATPAAEPAPEAPAVAEEVVPEPEPAPEAPVVAEEVTPEPEPEAPVVAEEVMPEPEPEAPAVAEEVVPEPEPEAPVVAEEVVPEPEPEAPVVAEEVVPEPEPEAPVVAEDVAPEPEPEAPVVADVLPEPEPEAPVVAEVVAPELEAPAPAPEPTTAPEAARLKPVQPGERTRIAALAETPAPSDTPEAVPASPGHVVIQPGNNLWRISRVIYGRGIEYTMIYEANRDQIDDPDLIYPGQIFATPGVNPPKEIDPGWREPLSPEDLARQNAAE